MKLRSYHRTLLAGVLATLGLVGCDGTAPAGSGSLLGVDIPEEFTFQTAQDVRVSLGDLAEQKIEIRLQTGEKIYEGPASVAEKLEFSIPSYQQQLYVSTADANTLELSVAGGLAQR